MADIYEDLNKMVEEEVNKGGMFSMKLMAYEKFCNATEKCSKDSYTELRESIVNMCRWWPEYIATLLCGLCIPIGETTSIDSIHDKDGPINN